MKLAICDDNENDLSLAYSCIQNYCKCHNSDLEIDCYSDELRFLNNATRYDCIFIDICMTHLTGIDIAEELRKTGSTAKIVFLTTSREYAVDAFRINASHYIVKPFSQQDINAAMARCFETHDKPEEKIIEIKTVKNSLPVPVSMSDIIYIEVFGKVATLYTRHSQLQTYTSLNLLMEQLDERFLRVQRSYIVNMNDISGFFTAHVEIAGKQISISRKNRGELKNQYQQFLIEKARRINL